MRKLFPALLFAGLACLASPAFANSQDELKDIDDTLQSCTEQDGSNVGMQDCTAKALEAADGILNRSYKAIVSQLEESSDSESLSRLKAAQRNWIPYRDSQCELEGAQMLGGSGEPLVRVGCLYRLTAARVKDLEDQFMGEQ